MGQTMTQASDTEASVANKLQYMPGFGNDFETETLPGALPQGQNSPQKCNYGLYAERLSGSPFTAPQGTKYAAELETLQDNYLECWDGLERRFDGTPGMK